MTDRLIVRRGYNLMLNSGKKNRTLHDKKNKYSNSGVLCCPKKKFWTKQKTIAPPVS
jgi:hypothetical protein